MPSYRFKCRECGQDFLKYYPIDEFEQIQYTTGHFCLNPKCYAPKMIVIKSNKSVNDRFRPGWQANIRKYCDTYAEYKGHLKNMGLIEIGYEDIPEYKHRTHIWTDEFIRKIVQRHQVNIDDGTARMLQDLDNEKCGYDDIDTSYSDKKAKDDEATYQKQALDDFKEQVGEESGTVVLHKQPE